ncbi:helix-turn-helix transcriptional regulator [Lichenicoccus sp.]|uniref:helix-turn-helix transcriptional regulator n=1 Tax=Lichenicoccus sp. TaxID=2781899 RepID=UPI003D13F2EF
MPDLDLLTLDETAERARISMRTLLKLVAEGRGPVITKLGARTFVRADHFAQWIEGNAQTSRHRSSIELTNPLTEQPHG